MIRLEQVRFRYDESPYELRVPALAIEAGEKVAIVAPSGAGKTTLLHLIAGILVPQAGSVRVNGIELSALGDAARRDFRCEHVGLVFQTFELLEYLDVAENIRLPYLVNRRLRAKDPGEAAVRELAAQAGLGEKLRRGVERLSQGERQRVALCRALIARPALLLADEPTGSLDPATGRVALDLLLELARVHRSTLVAVTHDRGLLGAFDRTVDLAELSARGPA